LSIAISAGYFIAKTIAGICQFEWPARKGLRRVAFSAKQYPALSNWVFPCLMPGKARPVSGAQPMSEANALAVANAMGLTFLTVKAGH